MMFYRGKRTAKRHGIRPVLLLLSLVLMLAIGAGGTLAFLIDDSGPVKNVFTPGEIITKIDEEFYNGDLVKKNVRIQNDPSSSTDVYIRATWTANWVDAGGNIVKPAEQGTDYTVAELPGSGWQKNGDYYYYTSAVAPGGYTSCLFTELAPVPAEEPDGAHLEVTILSQAIQAEPEQAIKEAWGVTISEGAVTPVSGT